MACCCCSCRFKPIFRNPIRSIQKAPPKSRRCFFAYYYLHFCAVLFYSIIKYYSFSRAVRCLFLPQRFQVSVVCDVECNAGRGQHLRGGKREPNPFGPEPTRKQHEARHQEQQSPQQCKPRGGQYALAALVVADDGQIHHKEHEPDGVVRKSVDGEPSRRRVQVEEQRHQPCGEEGE